MTSCHHSIPVFSILSASSMKGLQCPALSAPNGTRHYCLSKLISFSDLLPLSEWCYPCSFDVLCLDIITKGGHHPLLRFHLSILPPGFVLPLWTQNYFQGRFKHKQFHEGWTKSLVSGWSALRKHSRKLLLFQLGLILVFNRGLVNHVKSFLSVVMHCHFRDLYINAEVTFFFFFKCV